MIQLTKTIFLWNVEQSWSLRKTLSGHHQTKCTSPNYTNWTKCILPHYAYGCEVMFRHFATITMKTEVPLALPTLLPWGADWKDVVLWTSRESTQVKSCNVRLIKVCSRYQISKIHDFDEEEKRAWMDTIMLLRSSQKCDRWFIHFKLLQSPEIQSPPETFWEPHLLSVHQNCIMARRK